jgi:hypothetical protein
MLESLRLPLPLRWSSLTQTAAVGLQTVVREEVAAEEEAAEEILLQSALAS